MTEKSSNFYHLNHELNPNEVENDTIELESIMESAMDITETESSPYQCIYTQNINHTEISSPILPADITESQI
jgi:hypothetical protein